jgi:hypothetical protein
MLSPGDRYSRRSAPDFAVLKITVLLETADDRSMTNSIQAVSGAYDSFPQPKEDPTRAVGSGEEKNRSAAASGGKGSENPVKQPGDEKEVKAPSELDKDEQLIVDKLSQIDRLVRAHEAAHFAAGGSLVRGGPNYSYRQGPDGKRYAVAGEVNIDTSPIDGDPRATIIKAQRIQRAALAPADPSAQDRSVASAASSMAADAGMELARQTLAKQKGGEKDQPEKPAKVDIKK